MDIDSFKCSKGEGKQPTPPDMGYIAYTQQLEGSLIAFSAIHGDTLIYSLSGPIVKDHLTKIYLYGSMNTKYLGSGSTGYSGTDWNNTITPPQIIIKFYK